MISNYIKWFKCRLKNDHFWISEHKGKQLLDIGCSTGRFLELDKHNWVGIDINKKTVKECLDKGLMVIEGSATNIYFENESFDVILSSHLIEHLNSEDAYKHLKEIERLLRPNGLLILASPMPSIIHNPNFWGTFTHIKPYPPTSIKKIIGNIGGGETFNRNFNLVIEDTFYMACFPQLSVIGKPAFVILTFLSNIFPNIFSGQYIMKVRKQ